jgi:hypothetical protein
MARRTRRWSFGTFGFAPVSGIAWMPATGASDAGF